MTKDASSASSPTKIYLRLRDEDPSEGECRDVPKRTPFDWMRDPLTSAFARANVITDAIYLDTIFKRLYTGSPTFRALLAMNPDVARTPAMINLMENHPGAVRLAYNEVDINPTEFHHDPNGYVGVWVIAHEYRHVLQLHRGASIWDNGMPADDPTVPFRSFLALNRAMEGDSNAFAATCLYEVLRSEGLPGYQIENAMVGTTMSRIMRVTAELANCIEPAYENGHAASVGFDAFFHRSNQDILKGYDAKFMGIFKPFSVAASPEEKTQPDGFIARFNAMKTMPYLSEDGMAVEREGYLEDVDFSALKTLPHFGLRNRLHLMVLHAPPWARNP